MAMILEQLSLHFSGILYLFVYHDNCYDHTSKALPMKAYC